MDCISFKLIPFHFPIFLVACALACPHLLPDTIYTRLEMKQGIIIFENYAVSQKHPRFVF